MKLPKPSESKGDFQVPDPGVYRMEFTSYDEPELSRFKKENGDDAWRVKLEFVIRDEESDFDGSKVMAWFSWSMHPKSKLYPIVKAMLGREIDDDEEPDLDELIGTHIMGTLDHKTSKRDDGSERTFANLIAASPVRKKKPSLAAPPKKAPAPVADDDGIDWGDESDEDAA
jgi:hypothetical protein